MCTSVVEAGAVVVPLRWVTVEMTVLTETSLELPPGASVETVVTGVLMTVVTTVPELSAGVVAGGVPVTVSVEGAAWASTQTSRPTGSLPHS